MLIILIIIYFVLLSLSVSLWAYFCCSTHSIDHEHCSLFDLNSRIHECFQNNPNYNSSDSYYIISEFEKISRDAYSRYVRSDERSTSRVLLQIPNIIMIISLYYIFIKLTNFLPYNDITIARILYLIFFIAFPLSIYYLVRKIDTSFFHSFFIYPEKECDYLHKDEVNCSGCENDYFPDNWYDCPLYNKLRKESYHYLHLYDYYSHKSSFNLPFIIFYSVFLFFSLGFFHNLL